MRRKFWSVEVQVTMLSLLILSPKPCRLRAAHPSCVVSYLILSIFIYLSILILLSLTSRRAAVFSPPAHCELCPPSLAVPEPRARTHRVSTGLRLWAGRRERARAHAPPRQRPPITSTHHQHPLPPRPQLRQAQRRLLHMLPPHLWRCSQRKTLSTQLSLPVTPVPSRRATRYEMTRAHGDLSSGAGVMAARGPTSPRAVTPPTICHRVHVCPTPDRRTPVLL